MASFKEKFGGFMKIKLLVLFTFLFLGIGSVFAQKAEPKRIKFAKGKSSKTVTGVLRNNQQQEYVIGAKRGQLLTVLVSSRPKGKYHSFNIIGADGVDFTTDYDINYSYQVRLLESGDYVIFVTKRPTKRNKTARFYLTVKIKN